MQGTVKRKGKPSKRDGKADETGEGKETSSGKGGKGGKGGKKGKGGKGRFAARFNDPRFKPFKEKAKKWEDNTADSRFGIGAFSSRARVDSRGRPLAKDTPGGKDLSSRSAPRTLEGFYRGLGAEGIAAGPKGKKVKKAKKDEADDSEEVSEGAGSPEEDEEEPKEEEEEEEEEEASPSFEDDSVEADDGPDVWDTVYGRKGGGDDAEEEVEEGLAEATSRLAVKNCDWDHLTAGHLFAALQSFLPGGGAVKSVNIYLSQFGKEQLEIERKHGPRLWTKPGDEDHGLPLRKDEEGEKPFVPEKDEDQEDDSCDFDEEEDAQGIRTGEGEDGEKFSESRYRAYEMQRLRYYYAIVELDSSETAQHLFRQCDGMEVERSGTVFDLSFVPDEMTFDDEPTGSATRAPASIKGTGFITNALQDSRFAISWDQSDPKRKRAMVQAFEDEKKDDIDAFLAPCDDDSSDVEAGKAAHSKMRDKFRGLFADMGGLPEEKPPSGDEAEEGRGSKRGKVATDEAGEQDGGFQVTFSDSDAEEGEEEEEAEEGGEDDEAALVAQQLADMPSDDDSNMGNMEATFSAGTRDGARKLRETLDRKQRTDGETAWEARLRKRKEGRKAAKKEKLRLAAESKSKDNTADDERRLAKLRAAMGESRGGEEDDEDERGKKKMGRKDKRKELRKRKVEREQEMRAKKREARQDALRAVANASKPEPAAAAPEAVLDPRFSALAHDSRYAPDPTHGKYKRTREQEELDRQMREERRKRPRKAARSGDADRAADGSLARAVNYFKRKEGGS